MRREVANPTASRARAAVRADADACGYVKWLLLPQLLAANLMCASRGCARDGKDGHGLIVSR